MPIHELDFSVVSNTQEEVDDLIGHSPSWLLRSGISMFALVFFTVFSMSYFIKYPDKIEGTGTLTSESPPIELVSRSNGYIDTLLVQEDQVVRKGDIIAHISNTTNPAEIASLEAWIETYEANKKTSNYLQMAIPKNLQLGVLQSEYASLCLRFDEMQQTQKNSLVFQQVQNIDEEIEKLRTLNHSKKREQEIFKQELALAHKDYERNKNLYEEQAISQIDAEQAQVALLQKERLYEGMKNTIIQNNIRIEQLELEQLRLQRERNDELDRYQFSIAEIIARIRASIENWHQTYSIEAPIDGVLSLNTSITKNRSLKMEQVLGYILPEQTNKKFLSCSLPILNMGKVETGQQVIVKFYAYPHKEFGLVSSEVATISKVPENNSDREPYYEVKALLSEPIITDIGEHIPYHPNMLASVAIITEDKSLLERIFNQFIALIKDKSL